MMKAYELSLSPELQTLVEMRLDLVERVLIDARLSRSERGSILQELEGQILQLIERRTEHPTREDVLAVLADLDPPEAFLAETDDWMQDSPRTRTASSRPLPQNASHSTPPAQPPLLAIWSGVLVGGTALMTGFLMCTAVWMLPELVLGLVAIIQIVALIGAGLGMACLLRSKPQPASGLERALASASAATAPLTLLFLLAMASLFVLENEISIFVLSGFVGGACIHGAWLAVTTYMLWVRRLQRTPETSTS